MSVDGSGAIPWSYRLPGFVVPQRGEVISEGCVWKEILTTGISKISEKPTEGSICVLKIENIKRQETEKDASGSTDLASMLTEQNTAILTGQSEVTLTIGEADSEIDRRVEMAVRLMKDHEKSFITISLGDTATCLDNEKITFEATLLKHERFKPLWEWTPKEKYEVAMKYKNMGVKLFKDSEFSTPRYNDAFYRFSRACKILITLEPFNDLNVDDELSENIKTLRLKLYNNMAACQGKHHNYYHVIELCSKVLSKNDKNVQTLFRRGYAYGELKDYERAVQDFTKLLSIEPKNRLAMSKLRHYRLCLRQANIHCNAMVKRMFRTYRESSN